MRLAALLNAFLACAMAGLVGNTHADVPAGRPTTAATLRDLTGIRILHTTWGNFAGIPFNFISDLRTRGAVVDVLDHTTDPFPFLNSSYDILFLHSLGSVPAGSDLQRLLAWLRSGGKSIFFEGVTFGLIGTANVVSDSIGAGWHCRSLSALQSTITDFAAHPIMMNVHSLVTDINAYTEFTVVQSPGGELFRRPQGEIVGAFSASEGTRMAYLGMTMLWNNRLGLGDNRLLANQAVDWLAEIAATMPVKPVTWSTIKAQYRR